MKRMVNAHHFDKKIIHQIMQFDRKTGGQVDLQPPA